MTIALYPGAFDPITNGHLDIAIRAAKLFEKVIIGVYDTPDKNVLFNTEERLVLVRQSVADFPKIEAVSFGNLVVDFANEVGADTIVRGLRIGADFEREFAMAMMNKKLAPDCELVCLITSPKYQFVSSSLLKEVAGLEGRIDDLVPQSVVEALKKKTFSKV
ncbi:MAG: pantetheine-phosphate adenylyltransferase [Dehalococcoidales bacterium]|nr:pantetheine-phosphate adenylyltransferase [Dehalococcoidales bacterium]